MPAQLEIALAGTADLVLTFRNVHNWMQSGDADAVFKAMYHAFKVLAEVGADLSRFKSAKHFASWLGLCPGTKISGGKVLSGAAKRTTNKRAEQLGFQLVPVSEAP
jgi:transposase